MLNIALVGLETAQQGIILKHRIVQHWELQVLDGNDNETAKMELQKAKVELDNTEKKLEKAKVELYNAKTELEKVEAELEETKTEFELTREETNGPTAYVCIQCIDRSLYLIHTHDFSFSIRPFAGACGSTLANK
jgi:hypothetical protein